ncbi:ParB/RepB/Spo0J family partition protein [Desulfococcaceae bacterium HSG8]|nr:ParB/RepB/Spo0J family partition protein [Desulfococcaceae bacterium HSG8]
MKSDHAIRFPVSCVSLSDIDSGDHTYRITTETRADDLAHSIESAGLMSPPLLIKSRFGESGYIVVCGFRRIAACRFMGWPRIEARILEPDARKLDCAKWAITDNALQRSLNLIETSRSFSMLSEFFEDGKDMADAASALGIPSNPSLIRKVKPLCRLPEPIQNGILADTISLAMASELGLLEPREAGTGFAELFDSLRLSLSKQREIYTLVTEIALREDIPVTEILTKGRLPEILHNEDLDRNQKTREIRFYLKQRRFPVITETETAFESLIKTLSPRVGIRLIPPRHFEDMLYQANLTFRSLSELKERIAGLEKIAQNPALEKWLNR